MSKKTDFHEVERRAREAHKAELAKLYGVEGHEKLDALYKLAWDYGHANGFHDVSIHFGDMAELLTKDR